MWGFRVPSVRLGAHAARGALTSHARWPRQAIGPYGRQRPTDHGRDAGPGVGTCHDGAALGPYGRMAATMHMAGEAEFNGSRDGMLCADGQGRSVRNRRMPNLGAGHVSGEAKIGCRERQRQNEREQARGGCPPATRRADAPVPPPYLHAALMREWRSPAQVEFRAFGASAARPRILSISAATPGPFGPCDPGHAPQPYPRGMRIRPRRHRLGSVMLRHGISSEALRIRHGGRSPITFVMSAFRPVTVWPALRRLLPRRRCRGRDRPRGCRWS